MEQQIEVFLANLLSMGMKQEQVAEKGYEFALALLKAYEKVDAPVTAIMMFRASLLIKNALPGAYRNYDLDHRMR